MVSQGGRGLRTCSGSDWTGTSRSILAARTAQIRLPAITQLTPRLSTSVPVAATRSADTLWTRLLCGLACVFVGCQHQAVDENSWEADVPHLVFCGNRFVSTRRENMAFVENGQGRFFSVTAGGAAGVKRLLGARCGPGAGAPQTQCGSGNCRTWTLRWGRLCGILIRSGPKCGAGGR